jgi:photosystem II stability/assembly factor-like uncharacterized protein
MPDLAILEITDGTTTIDLLNSNVGWHLDSWRPAIAGLKGGGTYQDSNVAPGRDLTFGVFGNANETFNLKVNDYDQDALIEETQDLLRLLQKARDYWLTTWQDEPVYIKARAACETNTRYALIKNYSIRDLDNPYAQPFNSVSQIVAMDRIALGIERDHWQVSAPAIATCQQANNQETWYYEANWLNSGGPIPGAAILKLANGYLLAGSGGAAGNIYRSTDNGQNWALVSALPTGQVQAIVQLPNGDVLAYDGFGAAGNNVYRSQDNGLNWALYSNVPNATHGVVNAFVTQDGSVLVITSLAANTNGIDRSTDNGLNYANVYSGIVGFNGSFTQAQNGNIIATIFDGMRLSTDDGQNWNTKLNSFFPYHFIRQPLSDGTLLATIDLNNEASLLASTDNGLTWSVRSKFALGFTSSSEPHLHTDGNLYVLLNQATDAVYASNDNGFTFRQESDTFPATGFSNQGIGLFASANDDSLVHTNIYRITDSTTVGHDDADCDSSIYFSNKYSRANFTHIKIDDGGVFTDIYPITSFPQDLMPAVPAVNDAIYFGVESTHVDYGPFDNIVFNIGTPLLANDAYTIIWEQWTGAAWTTINVQDNTDSFALPGVNSVHLLTNSNWTTTAVDGVTALWTRARLSVIVGAITTIPTQDEDQIYTIFRPSINVDDSNSNILGDIPALLQLILPNESADDNNNNLPYQSKRILAGLRSDSRGTDFVSHLNISDTQFPFGVSVSLGTNTSFASDIGTPTGRYAQYNPAGIEAMATRATVSLDSGVAPDFYGVFHAFLRVQRTAGASTDFDVRLQVVSGSGGVSETTDSLQVQTTTQFEVLDFGQIKIPVAGSLSNSEQGDNTELRVQASASSGTPNLNLYDLILIPTDEWSIDAIDKANETDSDIGRSNATQKLLDIDSITYPKETIRTLVRDNDSQFITAIYDAITPGQAILQSNTDQRLWFFAMQTSATGSSYSWIAPPEITHSVQVFKAERYLGLRGAR